MSVALVQQGDGASDEAAEAIDRYDLWRARRDLEHFLFEFRGENGAVPDELTRLRDFLQRLSDKV